MPTFTPAQLNFLKLYSTETQKCVWTFDFLKIMLLKVEKWKIDIEIDYLSYLKYSDKISLQLKSY